MAGADQKKKEKENGVFHVQIYDAFLCGIRIAMIKLKYPRKSVQSASSLPAVARAFFRQAGVFHPPALFR
jgi:hypothetical protein